MTPLQIQRFGQLFTGYSKAFGQIDPRTMKYNPDKGKTEVRSWTQSGCADASHIQAHLTGSGYGLGIVVLGDDDLCHFGAIDLDVYNADPVKAERIVKKKGLPLVVCRTKSGGIHYFVFATGPVPAEQMHAKLVEWAAALGIAVVKGKEIEKFPKQTARFNENDIGSWINLPYYAAASTERYAIVNGEAATLDQFLDYAEGIALDPVMFAPPPVIDAEDDTFYEGPPCLQMIAASGGFAEGTRNDGMMAVVTYCKRRWPDSWESKVDAYNMELAKLPSSEIQSIIKSFRKKDYSYACRKAPLSSHCQRRVCLTRMYGVGESTPESRGVEITNVTKYEAGPGDEPLWAMDVNNKRILVTNSQFYSKDEFNKVCMAQVSEVPAMMTPQRWLKYLSEVIQNVTVVKLPEDAGPSGQLWTYIENFCQQRARAQTWEEMVLGKPRFAEGRVFFRSQDLFAYLDARKVPYKSAQQVFLFLKERGAEKGYQHVGESGFNWWSLPVKDAVKLDPEAAEIDLGSEEF